MRAPILLTHCAPLIRPTLKRARPLRTLRLETLERRWVFTAAPVAAVTDAGACLPEIEIPSVPAIPAPEGEAVAPAAFGPAYPVVTDRAAQLAPASFTAIDTVFAEAGDEPEGEGTYFIHLDMTSMAMGNRVWNFSGTVQITGQVGTVWIKFGGLLEGHTTTINQYGQFSYSYQFAAGTVGQVTGQAISSLGYKSNIDTEFIMV